MNKLMRYIETNPIKSLAIVIFICFVYAVIIHIAFKIEVTGFFQANWNAGDLLTYGSSILSLIGTLFLGYMAYIQGERANSMNQRLLELELNKEISNKRPVFQIEAFSSVGNTSALNNVVKLKYNSAFALQDISSEIKPLYIYVRIKNLTSMAFDILLHQFMGAVLVQLPV